MKVVNRSNTESYPWGEGATGWHLLNSDQLSVIEELVPPGISERRHYHKVAQQFFYVLAGTATLEVAGNVYSITAGSGMHVPAQLAHQLTNNEDCELRFLVVSQPKSHDDRELL